MIYVEQEFQQMRKLKEIPNSTRRSRSYLSEKSESSNANQAGSISAATPAASIANRQSTADYVAQIRAKTELEEIVESRWRYSDFLVRIHEMTMEFRSDMTGTIQVKKGPQTVVDTQITFKVVSERNKNELWPTIHITLSDESTVNASITIHREEAWLHSPSANGQVAEEVARFFNMRNRFKRQPLDPASAK